MSGKNADCKELEERFNAIDTDHSGFISKAELKKVLSETNHNIPDSQFEETFDFFNDGDGKGDGDDKITFEEFKKGLQRLDDFIKEITEIFKRFDADGSGCLDRNELKKVLIECGHTFTDAEINDILTTVDPNGDGKISLEEFIPAFT